MVEWKKLGEICEIIRGNGVQKTDFVEKGVGCIHYGQIYTHYGPFTYTTNKFVSQEVFEKARKASKGDIIMTDTSENVEDICKSVAYLGEEDIAVSNHALILKHNQNPKFLTYSTLTSSFLNQKRKYVVGAKVSGIKPEHLAQIKIFLPSLSEQTRIVGILDKFTASIENLKEQIVERRKQYEHYRDQLLDLEGKEGVEMNSVAYFVKDRILASELTADNYTSVENLLKNKAGRKDAENVPTEGNWIKYQRGDVLIGNIRPYLRKIWLSDRDGGTNGDVIVVRCNDAMIPEFLYYCLASEKFFHYYNQALKDGKMPRGEMSRVLSYIIPNLSIEEQSRIVSILDTFEASIANLEAQLKEREKQYEYYRNKLLTFE